MLFWCLLFFPKDISPFSLPKVQLMIYFVSFVIFWLNLCVAPVYVETIRYLRFFFLKTCHPFPYLMFNMICFASFIISWLNLCCSNLSKNDT